jgi:hypothetical protein
LDYLVGIEPFQWVALTPGPKIFFGPPSRLKAPSCNGIFLRRALAAVAPSKRRSSNLARVVHPDSIIATSPVFVKQLF